MYHLDISTIEQNTLNIVWLTLCAFLVFFMQPGFLCLEAGLTRTKNAINVAIKNVADFGVSSLVFWGFGFGLMFGQTSGGWVGMSNFFPELEQGSAWGFSFFLFEVMFCGTAVTIISGAVAERISFLSYMWIATFVSAFIYPIFGHWVWGGALTGEQGWLAHQGFVDFAGASVVHAIGGWASLAIVIILGPRIGIFQSDKKQPFVFSGSNLPLAMTGVFFLWIGWIGFNGGSAISFSERVPVIIVNTILAGSAGMVCAGALGWIKSGYPKIIYFMNGTLAGLVAITAGCFAVSPSSAVVIGAVGGAVMVGATLLLERLKIDDVIGAVPVHLAAGIWGTLSVALFADLDILATGLGRLEQLQVQLYGVAASCAIGFGGTFIMAWVMNRLHPLRISRQAEIEGLNISENKEISDLYSLSQIMKAQEQSKDLALRVEQIDPYTEIGQIASQYNRLMDSLQASLTSISNLEKSKAEILAYQKRLNAILDNAVEGIITIDEKGLIQSYNKACEQIFGYSASEALGRNIKFLMPSPYAEEHDSYLRRYLETGEPRIIGSSRQLEARRKNGEIFPIDLSIADVRLGNERIFSGIIRDITKQKSTEDELRRSNGALALFATVASHDLKAPLNYITMCANMVKEGYEDKLDDEGREFLSVISKSALRMQAMIRNLMEYSRIGGGRDNFQAIETTEVVSEALQNIELEVQDSKADIRYAALPAVMGNRELLVQLFQNMIGNALKYRNPGVTPVVQIAAESRGNDWLFSLSDNGIGIDPKFKDKIFVIFQRLHTEDEYPGAGVGLSFCQRIVEFHGGKIWLDTDYKGGARFLFTLPATYGEDKNSR